MIVIIGEANEKIKVTLFNNNFADKIFSVAGENEVEFFKNLRAKFQLHSENKLFEKISEIDVHNGKYENSDGKRISCSYVNEKLKNGVINSIKRFINNQITTKEKKVSELAQS